MHSSAVFTGVNRFALKFLVDRVVPINHSWRQKTRDTRLLDSEDCIILRSLVLTQYRSVADGQRTDRRTDERNLPYTALSKLCFGAL